MTKIQRHVKSFSLHSKLFFKNVIQLTVKAYSIELAIVNCQPNRSDNRTEYGSYQKAIAD